MSRPRFAALAVPMLLTILILLLNLREKDNFGAGSPVPPRGDNVPDDDGTFRKLVPEKIAHPCPVCGDCTHPVETVENHRTLTIRDHDGWYRLFWAGDEIYHFEEFPLFAACLRNSTARDPAGRWKIRCRLGPPTHGVTPPHVCTPIPGDFSLEYELVVSPAPLEPEPPLRTDTPFSVLPVTDWFSFYPDRPHLPRILHFNWRLAGPPDIPVVRCECGKP